MSSNENIFRKFFINLGLIRLIWYIGEFVCVIDHIYIVGYIGFCLQIGDESSPKPQHHSIYIDDDSNQQSIKADNRSSTDIDSDFNCTNIGDKNIVMQDMVGTVG